MSEARKLKVFLCHSSGDKVTVRDLYKRLQADGFEPWLDEEDLLPGQEWAKEIPKAVRAAEAILVCLSQSSIGKEGYVQREIGGSLIFPVEDSTSSGLPVECERSAGTLRDPERAVGRDGRG